MKAVVWKVVEGWMAQSSDTVGEVVNVPVGLGWTQEEALADLAYKYDKNGEVEWEEVKEIG